MESGSHGQTGMSAASRVEALSTLGIGTAPVLSTEERNVRALLRRAGTVTH